MSINKSLLAGIITFALILLVGLVSIGLEKPTGGIAGRIALQEKDFNLSTYDMRGNKVYAMAIGPRGGNIIERGVWVNPDGTFQLSQLPVGEYSLRVRAPGFAINTQEGVFVDDAHVTQLKEAVHLALLAPSVNIASNGRVFTTREVPSFWVNATGSDRVKVSLYRKNVMDLLANPKAGLEFGGDLSLYKPYPAQREPLFAGEKPYKVFTRKLQNADLEDWARADFKLSKPLPPGEYVAVAEVANFKKQTDWNLMWFSVSDLGLIVKQAPEKTVVRAISLATLKPLPNVDVRLLARNNMRGAVIGLKKTGKDGFVTFPISGGQRNQTSYNFLALGAFGANRALGGIDYWGGGQDSYQTYFYTERPIYRLGQTVYFKGISRLKTQDGWKTPKAGTILKIAVEDPDNNKVWEGQVLTNANGTFHGTYQVPENGKTGGYQVDITYPDGNSSYNSFEVAQYRKPEYQVEVLPLEKRIVAGQKGKARVRATYYFGAPVANARIKYSIYADTDWSGRYNLMPRPDYYGYYDDWEDDSAYQDQSYAGDFISEGYAQTDESGEAVIEFDTRPTQIPQDDPYNGDFLDKRYTVQAEVTDLSRIAVVGSGIQSVSAGDFALFVQPGNAVQKAGNSVTAQITAVDYDGKPVAGRDVTVSLVRWNWDRVKEEYRGATQVGSVSVKTNAKGQASVQIPTDSKFFTDGYYLVAQAKDNGGRLIYDQENIWIASDAYPYIRDGESANQEAFSVRLDKAVYRPGETAKAMITAPVSGKENGQVIIAVEGDKLYDYWTIPMNATAKMVEIPLKTDYAPNVYVTATFVGPKHQFYNQDRIIKVSPERHFLNVQVTTNRPKYKPGEMATYTVKVTDTDGKPVKNTELSLGVVDESLYAIRPETARDIRKFFYHQHDNAVMTLSSFPEEYSGGPDKNEPRVRKDFRDMAAWLPELITNAQGIATATVKLPDNLTTWRATVRGISGQADVGSAIAKVIATQDLIVRLALPRFYTQYDKGYLTAIVHNYTTHDQKVTLKLQASPQFQTREALVRELQVKPEHAERYEWPVEIMQPGEGTVLIQAIGQTVGDAMEQKVPINALGVEMAQSTSGVFKADSGTVRIPLTIPARVNPAQAKLRFAVAASTLGPVLGNFDALIDYPYGCTEQTMSRLVPSIMALQLNRSLGVPLSPQARQRFDDVAARALARLKDYYNGDGGWGWWRYDTSDAYLTAYVMEGLFMLKEAGYPLDSYSLPESWQTDSAAYLHRSAEELAKQLNDPKGTASRAVRMDRMVDLAYMQYVLGLYGQKLPVAASQYITAHVQQAPPEALALATLAFKQANHPKEAQLAYVQLNRLADPAGGMLNWDHTPHLQKLLQLKEMDYSYRFTGVESTALALRAAIAMENPKASPAAEARLDAIERWLILQRDQSGWANTKTTAQVLRALLGKTLQQGVPADTHFMVRSNLWETAMDFTSANLYEPERVTEAVSSSVPGQSVTLEKQGLGRLYYNSLLTYLYPLQPGDTVPQNAYPDNLSVQRKFYRLQAEPVGPEGTLRLKTQPIFGNQVRAGETVLMKVVVNTDVALPYVITEVPLPSGGEVVSNDPRESAVDTSETSEADNALSGDWGSWWWTHQDILDDRVVMFAKSLPAGKSEFYALVRMELPGTFQMNPVKLEGMYSKHIRAYSPLDSLQVME